jgi:uncharacterized protein YecT (DUF1311 family)
MKKRKLFYTVVVLALVALVCVGCGGKKGKEESAASSQSSAQTSSQPVSSAQSNTESTPLSSESAVDARNPSPTESQPGPVIIIETDDKEFNKLFKENPIDKVYIQESNKAFSSVEMIQLSDKYADIWSKEVTSAYNKLIKAASGDELAKIKAEQTKWLNGKAEALKKISDKAQAAGGTMAQVDASSGYMDYYRTRAAELYKQLYHYDKNYTYAYKK